MPDKGAIEIGVVIPFFQTDSDILPRCIASVFAQDVPDSVRFIVVAVDDESPLPLAEALQDISIPPRHELIRLNRPNGGPGAARNTALDYLATRHPDFVAFIDSDDIWRPGHVARALTVLAQDADFFFCDHERWDYPTSYLEDSVQFQHWSKSADSCLRLIGSAGLDGHSIFEFEPAEAFYAFIEDYLAQTSTVFYRFAPCAQIRFDPTLRHAGEDNMFWLELSNAVKIVRLSTAKDVVTGKGVNMFAGTTSWSHPKAAQRTAAQVRFFMAIRSRFCLDARAKCLVSERLNRHQTEFSEVWVRKFLRNPFEAIFIMWPLMTTRPTMPLIVAWHILRRDIKKWQ